jgi:hypothetical protein
MRQDSVSFQNYPDPAAIIRGNHPLLFIPMTDAQKLISSVNELFYTKSLTAVREVEDKLDNWGLLENYQHNLKDVLGYGHLSTWDIAKDWRAFDSFIRATPQQRIRAINMTVKHIVLDS